MTRPPTILIASMAMLMLLTVGGILTSHWFRAAGYIAVGSCLMFIACAAWVVFGAKRDRPSGLHAAQHRRALACPSCGYARDGLGTTTCPECGYDAAGVEERQ